MAKYPHFTRSTFRPIFNCKTLLVIGLILSALTLVWWEIELIIVLAKRGDKTIPEDHMIPLPRGLGGKKHTPNYELLRRDLMSDGSYLPFPTHWLEAYSSLHASMIEGKLPRRFIVYRAGYDYKGGLGDRVAGMTSALMIGLLTNRALLVDMPRTMWSDYVHSPFFDTTYRPSLVDDLSMRTLEYTDRLSDLEDVLVNRNLNEEWTESVLIIECNQPAAAYLFANVRYRHTLLDWRISLDVVPPLVPEVSVGHTKCTPYDNALGSLYRILAIPNRRLQSKIDKYVMHRFGRTNLGFHFRFGGSKGQEGLMNDWIFSTKEDWFWQCAESYRTTTERWFIASDTNSVIEDAQDREGKRIFHVKGIPKHHDPSISHHITDDQMLKLFLDHFLLSECDAAVISQSAFSRWNSPEDWIANERLT